MHALPSHVARAFDDPHAGARHDRRAQRARTESRGRVAKRRTR
jgi:hypothetical protein